MQLQVAHIQAFVAVADTLNFAAAARLLYIAPSRLSQRIQEAEKEVGAPLFRRTTRRTELTPAGISLLPRARAIILELETIEAMFRTDIDQAVGVGVRSLPTDFRDELLATIERTVAPAKIAPQPLDSERQLQLLRVGVLDFALVWYPTQEPGIHQLPILREAISIAVPASDKFRALPRVAPADVIGLRLAATIDPRNYPADIQSYLEALPLIDRVNPAVEGGLPLLLSGGNHCAFVPGSTRGHSHLTDPDTHFLIRPLTNETFITTYFMWRDNESNQELIDSVATAVRRKFPTPEIR